VLEDEFGSRVEHAITGRAALVGDGLGNGHAWRIAQFGPEGPFNAMVMEWTVGSKNHT
jgi:hypothetical protein